MKCTLCFDKTELPVDRTEIVEHLIIIKTKNHHYHIHGPLGNKKEILTMIELLCEHANINIKQPQTRQVIKKKDISPEQKRFSTMYNTTESGKFNKRVP